MQCMYSFLHDLTRQSCKAIQEHCARVLKVICHVSKWWGGRGLCTVSIMSWGKRCLLRHCHFGCRFVSSLGVPYRVPSEKGAEKQHWNKELNDVPVWKPRTTHIYSSMQSDFCHPIMRYWASSISLSIQKDPVIHRSSSFTQHTWYNLTVLLYGG